MAKSDVLVTLSFKDDGSGSLVINGLRDSLASLTKEASNLSTKMTGVSGILNDVKKSMGLLGERGDSVSNSLKEFNKTMMSLRMLGPMLGDSMRTARKSFDDLAISTTQMAEQMKLSETKMTSDVAAGVAERTALRKKEAISSSGWVKQAQYSSTPAIVKGAKYGPAGYSAAWNENEKYLNSEKMVQAELQKTAVATEAYNQKLKEQAKETEKTREATKGATAEDERAGFGKLGLVSKVITLMLAYSALRSVMSAISYELKAAFTSTEEYNQSVVEMAALMTTFSARSKTDLAGAWEESYKYAQLLVVEMQKLDMVSAASADELKIMVQTFMKFGVVLDVNNKKQIEAFKDFSNATKVLLANYPNMAVQLRSELDAIMNGQAKQTDLLAKIIQAKLGGAWASIVQKAKETGTFFELMQKVFGGFGQAADKIADLWVTLGSSMSTLNKIFLRGAFTQAHDDLIQFVKDFMGLFRDAKGGTTELAKSIQDTLKQAWIEVKFAVIDAYDAIKLIFAILSPFIKALWEMRDAIKAITVGLVTMALIKWFVGLSLIKDIVFGFNLLGAAIEMVRAKQMLAGDAARALLTTLLPFGPGGWIIIAIGALAAAWIYLSNSTKRAESALLDYKNSMANLKGIEGIDAELIKNTEALRKLGYAAEVTAKQTEQFLYTIKGAKNIPAMEGVTFEKVREAFQKDESAGIAGVGVTATQKDVEEYLKINEIAFEKVKKLKTDIQVEAKDISFGLPEIIRREWQYINKGSSEGILTKQRQFLETEKYKLMHPEQEKPVTAPKMDVSKKETSDTSSYTRLLTLLENYQKNRLQIIESFQKDELDEIDRQVRMGEISEKEGFARKIEEYQKFYKDKAKEIVGGEEEAQKIMDLYNTTAKINPDYLNTAAFAKQIVELSAQGSNLREMWKAASDAMSEVTKKAGTTAQAQEDAELKRRGIATEAAKTIVKAYMEEQAGIRGEQEKGFKYSQDLILKNLDYGLTLENIYAQKETDAKLSAINEEETQTKWLYDQQLISATDYYSKIKTLIDADTDTQQTALENQLDRFTDTQLDKLAELSEFDTKRLAILQAMEEAEAKYDENSSKLESERLKKILDLNRSAATDKKKLFDEEVDFYAQIEPFGQKYHDLKMKWIDEEAARLKIKYKEDFDQAKWVTKEKMKFSSEAFFKENEDRQQAFSSMATSFNQMAQLYKEGSDARIALSNASKVATMAEIALQVQKNIMIAIGAVLNQATGEPYSAFARIAAMIAVVAGVLAIGGIAFGISGGSSGSTSTSNLPASTVLGAEAGTGSDSAQKSFDLLQDTYDMEYRELAELNNSIKDLNTNITGLVTSIVRTGGITTTGSFKNMPENTQSIIESTWGKYAKYVEAYFLPTTLIWSTILKPLRNVINWFNGIIGDIIGGIVGGEVDYKVKATGIKLGAITIRDLLAGVDIAGQQYADIKKTTSGGWFGSDKVNYFTLYKALDEDITALFTNVFASMGDTLVALAKSFGTDMETTLAYMFPEVKLNLKGKTSEEINTAINEFISKAGDVAVEALFGDIVKGYQQVSEGLLETAIRLAQDKAIIADMIEMTGQTFAGTIPEIIAFTEAIITMAGGIDELTTAASGYYDKFFTDAEKQTRTQTLLTEYLSDMGMILPQTREGFRTLVESLDLTTTSGQEAYVTLMQLAESADTYYSFLEEIADNYKDLSVTLDNAITNIYDLDDALYNFQESLRVANENISDLEDGITDLTDPSDILTLKTAIIDRYQLEIDIVNDLADALKTMQDNFSTFLTTINARIVELGGTASSLQSLIDMYAGNAQVAYNNLQTGKGTESERVAWLQTIYTDIEQWYDLSLTQINDIGDAQKTVYQDRIDNLNDEQDVLDKQKDVLQDQLDLVEGWGDVLTSVKATIEDMKTSTTSPRDVYERLEVARQSVLTLQGQFKGSTGQEQIAYATQLQDAISTYSSLAQEAYQRPSTEYQSIYNQIIGWLEEIQGIAEPQAATEKDLLSQIADIDKKTKIITDEIADNTDGIDTIDKNTQIAIDALNTKVLPYYEWAKNEGITLYTGAIGELQTELKTLLGENGTIATYIFNLKTQLGIDLGNLNTMVKKISDKWGGSTETTTPSAETPTPSAGPSGPGGVPVPGPDILTHHTEPNPAMISIGTAFNMRSSGYWGTVADEAKKNLGIPTDRAISDMSAAKKIAVIAEYNKLLTEKYPFLKDVTGKTYKVFDSGGYVTSPTMGILSKNNVPEIVSPVPMLKRIVSESNNGGNVTISPQITINTTGTINEKMLAKAINEEIVKTFKYDKGKKLVKKVIQYG